MSFGEFLKVYTMSVDGAILCALHKVHDIVYHLLVIGVTFRGKLAYSIVIKIESDRGLMAAGQFKGS